MQSSSSAQSLRAMTRRWSEREREQHIEDLKEVRRRFRQEVVEAKQSGNTYAYVQARKKLFEVQQDRKSVV